MNDDIIKVGDIFKHFKGSIYVVKEIATHTETGEVMIVYSSYPHSDGKVWVRPYKMFTSEVDHKKYPEVSQKMRFLKIDWKHEDDGGLSVKFS